jgi:hypothetical protein
MTGKAEVLVAKPSATHCRPWEESNDYLCPINRDHSDMVKFRSNDNNYDIVLVTLRRMVSRATKEKRCMPQKDEESVASRSISEIPRPRDKRKLSGVGSKRPRKRSRKKSSA